ncbi:BlaI/MecI/CopY family transcriptional regulator [Clostridioides difficile]
MELTKNEIEIMEVLWKEQRPLTRTEIVNLSVNKSWKESSIHILLNSLLKKNAIREAGYVRTGKGFGRTFEPTKTGESFYADVLAKIVRKTNVSVLFSKLVESEDITEETIEELEELLKEKKRKN